MVCEQKNRVDMVMIGAIECLAHRIEKRGVQLVRGVRPHPAIRASTPARRY
jgi:hypothetical protein